MKDLGASLFGKDTLTRAGRVTGKFSAKRIDRGLDRIRNVLSSIETDRSYAKAGVMGKEAVAPRPAEPGEEEGAERLTNVKLATIHEFGAPSRGIPERSFIRAPFAQHREEYIELLAALVKAAVYEGRMPYTKALRIVALKMATDMKLHVTTGPGVQPPNAPATIERKIKKGLWNLEARNAKRRKQGKPLIAQKDLPNPRALVDTGRLVGSITWAVVVKDTADIRAGHTD